MIVYLDVRLGSKSEVTARHVEVRFTPKPDMARVYERPNCSRNRGREAEEMIRSRSSASPNFFALFEGDDPSKLTTHIAK